MEYYSVFKKKTMCPFVIIWMNLEDTAQSEISQTQDRYCMFPLIQDNLKVVMLREQNGGFQDLKREGSEALLFNGYEL